MLPVPLVWDAYNHEVMTTAEQGNVKCRQSNIVVTWFVYYVLTSAMLSKRCIVGFMNWQLRKWVIHSGLVLNPLKVAGWRLFS